MNQCYIIEDDESEKKLLDMMGVDSLEKASFLYTKQTGMEVIDRREDTEYSNVNAQRDPDFWAEESITA